MCRSQVWKKPQNRLINAADSVRHVRMELLEMDLSSEQDEEEERFYEEELEEEGDGSGKGFIDDIRRWFRIADGEDTADGADALPDDDLFKLFRITPRGFRLQGRFCYGRL